MKTKKASESRVLVLELGYKGERVPAEAPALKLKQILVPSDFSDCSEKARRYALAFAQQFLADLVLLHVIELYPIDYLLGVKSSVEANACLRDQVQQRLQQLSRH
jgi:nucleotide-binding universal stress UspA family protein